MIPALDVAMAGKPSSSKTRALATSHAFGKMSNFLPRWRSRNSFAFSTWSVIHTNLSARVRMLRTAHDSRTRTPNPFLPKVSWLRSLGPRDASIDQIGSGNDLEHELAASVTQETPFVGVAGPRKGIHGVDNRANAAGVNQVGDLNELRSVRLHQHGYPAHAVFRSDRFGSVACDRDEDSTRT